MRQLSKSRELVESILIIGIITLCLALTVNGLYLMLVIGTWK